MPRNGSGVYSLPVTYLAIDGDTVESVQHNDPLEDIQEVMNEDWPGAAKLSGATMTGPLKTLEQQETVVTLTGTGPSIDCETGTVFEISTTGNTTFAFANPPEASTATAFTLVVTSGGSHTLTWPGAVAWPDGLAPDAPASGETDIYVFMTLDAGSTWYGVLVGGAFS